MNALEEIKKRLGELQKQNFEAYETATWTPDKIMYRNCANAYANAIEIVNKVEKEYNNGWIPCSERLPDKEGTYLVTLKKGGICFARFVNIKNYPHFDISMDVLAWQPLPQPYTEPTSKRLELMRECAEIGE